MDAQFSIAIHILILVSESDAPLSSDQIAESVGVNASHIRKISSSLKRAGLLSSKQGVRGVKLAREAQDITLMDIYQAIYKSEFTSFFPLHKNPNDKCIVGRHIHPTLESAFADVAAEAIRAMRSQTLKSITIDMKNKIIGEGEPKCSLQLNGEREE